MASDDEWIANALRDLLDIGMTKMELLAELYAIQTDLRFFSQRVEPLSTDLSSLADRIGVVRDRMGRAWK